MKSHKILITILLITICTISLVACKKDKKYELEGMNPLNTGMPALDVYSYPCLGMDIRLNDRLLKAIKQKEIYMTRNEKYKDNSTIIEAELRWYYVDENVIDKEVTSLDPHVFEKELELIGSLGMYLKDSENINELSYEDLIKSDNKYNYYLRYKDSKYIDDIKNIKIVLYERENTNIASGINAFSNSSTHLVK